MRKSIVFILTGMMMAGAVVAQESVDQTVDVPAVIEASRALYVSGDFEGAQRGFEQAVKLEPDNMLARMYLRRIRERGHREAQVRGMKEIRDGWDESMVLSTYRVSEDGQKKMGLSSFTESTDVVSLFPEVQFPKNSSAVYHPNTGRLVVRNTRENLAVIDEILDAMDIYNRRKDVDQVEIEAKFVEVAAGTLEALGFEWDFVNPVSTGLEGSDIIMNDGAGLFVDALRASPSGSSPTLPFGQPGNLMDAGLNVFPGDAVTPTTRPLEDSLYSSDNVLPFIRLNNRAGRQNELDLLITALDQVSGTDVLSSPRLVTRSGEAAEIRVGQLHYFPEIYEVGANEGNMVHVLYESFTETLLGVELKVTPRVDGGQITMGLNPVVRELAGWQNFMIAPANSSYTYVSFRIGSKFFHDDPIVARLPIFQTRRIQTEVTIADGSTIGMGGLINERTESYKDKVPVLGNIPLVGRLFRNEGQRSVKRNLLMFVSARTIDPSGQVNVARSFE